MSFRGYNDFTCPFVSPSVLFIFVSTTSLKQLKLCSYEGQIMCRCTYMQEICTNETVSQGNSSESAQKNVMKLCS